MWWEEAIQKRCEINQDMIIYTPTYDKQVLPGARCRLPWVLALRRPPGEQQSDVPAFGCPLEVGTLMNPLFLGGTRHGCVLYQPTLSPGSLPSTLLWHCPAPSNHYSLLFLLFMLFDNICTVQCRCSHYSLLFLLSCHLIRMKLITLCLMNTLSSTIHDFLPARTSKPECN